MLKDNLRKAFAESGLCVREIAEKSGVRKRTIDEWVGGRGKMPGAEALYKVCKTLEMTVEEALEGEKGRQYVWNLAAGEGGVWKPPERIAGIVQDLLGMDEKSLSIIRGTIGGIAEGEKALRKRRA